MEEEIALRVSEKFKEMNSKTIYRELNGLNE